MKTLVYAFIVTVVLSTWLYAENMYLDTTSMLDDGINSFGTASVSYGECAICGAVCSIWEGQDYILTFNTATFPVSEWDHRIAQSGANYKINIDAALCSHCEAKYAHKITDTVQKVYRETVVKFQEIESVRRLRNVEQRYTNQIDGLSKKIRDEQENLEQLKKQLKEIKCKE